MTREEAIRWMIVERSYIREVDGNDGGRLLIEAYDMAIETLSAEASQDLTEPNKELKGSDLISRQDAIRWVKTECNPYGKPTLDFESGKRVMEHLEQMPSAEPKTGEWIPNHDGSWNCSECGLRVLVYAKGNYCPNCGARMKGGEGE